MPSTTLEFLIKWIGWECTQRNRKRKRLINSICADPRVRIPDKPEQIWFFEMRQKKRCTALLKRRANWSIKPTHRSLHLIECFTRAASICSFFWIWYPKTNSIYSQTITIVTHRISFCVHIVLTTVSSLFTMHTNTQRIVNHTCLFLLFFRLSWL